MSSKKKSSKPETKTAKAPRKPRSPAKPLAERLLLRAKRAHKAYHATVAAAQSYGWEGNTISSLISEMEDGLFVPTTGKGRRDRQFKEGDAIQVKEKYSNNGAIPLEEMKVAQVIGEGRLQRIRAITSDGSIYVLPRAQFERVS